MEFKDRQATFPNRKKLTIISQSPNEIIADVERFDNASVLGTKINAEVFNDLQQQINTANTNADEANTIANQALKKVNELEDVIADRGATVLFGDTKQAIVKFNSNPQEQIDNKLEKNFSSYSAKSLLASSDTFIIQEAITNESKSVSLAQLINVIYPVGAVYISSNLVNPSALFGGVWEQIQDRFLLSAGASYTAGTIGGEATHTLSQNEMPMHSHVYDRSSATTNDTTLTINQMPAHSHKIWSCNNWSGNTLGVIHSDKVAGVGFVENRGFEEKYYSAREDGKQIIEDTGDGDGHSHGINLTATDTSIVGNTRAHNNMPPFLVVYMWKRIS